MTSPLWKKGDVSTDERVQRYMAGHDVALDRHLFPYDITASIAHVRGLQRIDVLTAEETSALCDALNELAGLFERGEFVLDEQFEDGHTAIEAYLSEQLGDVGRKVHLGRSRNDQVLTAQRLFGRAMLDEIAQSARAAAQRCLDLAERECETIMPGYTHLQRAVPSTVGLWLAAFTESFIDDAELIGLIRKWMNACPLGTAAGYGVNAPLDRDFTCADLGFDRLLVNPMHAQNTRGQHEVQALSACWQVMQTVRRLAWDLSLFSTSEFGFVRLGDAVSTGSSIMPNKRNPDLVEMMRGGAAVVAGAMSELQQALSLPSGYHRDLQLTKEPVIRGLVHTRDTIDLIPTLLDSVEFDRETMLAAISPEMLATDRATDLALNGLPFREAYLRVAAELGEGRLAEGSAEASIQGRISQGACADLRLHELRLRIKADQVIRE